MNEGNNLDWREFNSIPSPRVTRSKGLASTKDNDELKMSKSLQLNLLMSTEFDHLQQKIIILESRIEYLNGLILQNDAIPSNSIPTSFLDDICENTFSITPTPSKRDLNSLLASIDGAFPNNDRKSTQSEIRKWFRKKREKTTLKVCGLLDKNYPESYETEEKSILLESIVNNDSFILELLLAAGVNFEDEQSGIQYFRDRLKNHLLNKEP